MERYDQLFPEYHFIKLVGQGSYGDVFYCYRKADNKKVALKVVRGAVFASHVDSGRETVRGGRSTDHASRDYVYEVLSASQHCARSRCHFGRRCACVSSVMRSEFGLRSARHSPDGDCHGVHRARLTGSAEVFADGVLELAVD